jgi:hypothetical protein
MEIGYDKRQPYIQLNGVYGETPSIIDLPQKDDFDAFKDVVAFIFTDLTSVNRISERRDMFLDVVGTSFNFSLTSKEDLVVFERYIKHFHTFIYNILPRINKKTIDTNHAAFDEMITVDPSEYSDADADAEQEETDAEE